MGRQVSASFTHFTLHCYRIDVWGIRRPWLTFVNALANSILGRFYIARTQRFASCAWPMVLRKLRNRWKWKGESWFHYISGSQTMVRVPLVVREGFSGGTRAAFLSYSKSFVNSFLCYNSFVYYANVANSFISYINLKYIWANYVLLKPRGVHSNLKKTSGGTRSQKVWEPLHYIKVLFVGVAGIAEMWFDFVYSEKKPAEKIVENCWAMRSWKPRRIVIALFRWL